MQSQQLLVALGTLGVIIAVGLLSGPASAADAGSCDPSRPHPPGNFNETTVSGALTREYILHVPPSYNGSSAVPLVLNLHGSGLFAWQQKFYSDLAAKADEAGFVLVMPQAIGVLPDHERQWDVTTLFPGAPDDVGFIADLLDALESELCIDSARVYSTGISNGASMSVRLACSLSGRIAAIAPVAGVYWPPVSPDFPEPADCPLKSRPVPVIGFHGTDDLYVPFNGGLGIGGTNFRLSIEAAIAEWAANDGCATGPTESQAAPGVRLVRYEDCDEGAIVELYDVEDADGNGPGTEAGGHTWPGSPIDLEQLFPGFQFGKTTQEISANDLMWDFFVAHPLGEPKAVGGITELPDVAGTPLEAGGSPGRSASVVGGVVAAVAAALALGGAAWYARRRGVSR